MTQTLYEQVGGEESIRSMVATFYQRVLSDPMLKPFFEHTDMDKLKRMQTAFFTIALGGPEPDFRISLYEAHSGRGILVKHLTRYTELLMETLEEVGVKKENAQKIYERIATYSNDVLGESSVDG